MTAGHNQLEVQRLRTLRRRRLAMIVVASGAAASIAIWAFLSVSGPENGSRIAPLPPIDLSGAEERVAEVIERARRRVEENPESSGAWGRLGMLLRAHDYAREAHVCLAQAARLDPGEFRWPYILGASLGRYEPERAVQALRRAVELRPSLALARQRLAELLLDLDRLGEAEEQLLAARRIAPDDPRTLLNIARLRYLQGDYQSALAEARSAVAAVPDRRKPRELLARIHYRLGHAAEAEKLLDALNEFPREDPLWYDPYLHEVRNLAVNESARLSQLQRMLQLGESEAAIAALERLVTRHPDDPQHADHLARALTAAGRLEEAAGVLDRALARCPDSGLLYRRRGVVHASRSQWEKAAGDFLKATKHSPPTAELHALLGESLEHLGRSSEAIAAYGEAVRLRPDFARAHARLGRLLLESGDRAEAARHLSAAVRLNAEDSDSRQLLKRASTNP